MYNINEKRRRNKSAALFLITALLLTGFFLSSSMAETPERIITLEATAQDDTVTLSFADTTNEKINYKIFILETPPRLVIDFPEARFKKCSINEIIKKSGYSHLRSFNYDDLNKARIVIDTEYATLPPFTQQAQGHKLLVTLKKSTPESIKFESKAKPKKTTATPQKKQAYKPHNNPITVDFKGTDIQNVFRFLAEINNLNVVMGDNVSGTVTLRLKAVPWKQVLNIVLKTHQLGMERVGNVVRIAPLGVFINEQQAIDEKRRAEADNRKAEEEIQDTVLKILKVNFADIDEIASKIESAILSDRGSVETDLRTNSLIINDIPDRIRRAEALLQELDEPVKQVMIEAKIVKIERNSGHEFGVQWGGAYGKTDNDRYYGISGNNSLASTGREPVNFVDSLGSGTVNSNYAVNLPVQALTSGIGMVFGKIDKYNLNLQLSAMQEKGTARILSNPKVLALNQHEAKIGQGQQIPYKSYDNGATSTDFEDAELSLTVTPTITNNNMISMEVEVTKDSVGQITPDGVAINTQDIKTSLLLKDNETAVIGGIIESDETDSTDSVPVLGKIPLLGWLFKHDQNSNSRTELMIFITPKIIR